MDKDYKRFTTRNEKGEWTIELNEELKWAQRDMSTDDFISSLFDLTAQRLCDLEDKIENGTLVFKKEIPNKYYAVTLCLDYDDKWVWDIHYGPIEEYDERTGFFAIEDGGRSWRVSTNMLFKTKAEAEAKLRELKEKENADKD